MTSQRIHIALLSLLLGASAVAAVSQVPVQLDHTTRQLLVSGQPFTIFGGELGNSSASTTAQADTILARIAQLHVNTVLMPVPWAEIEPAEGHFDFTILDHWIATARAQHLHLVLLWFGSWKNSTSSYAPSWVQNNPQRFPRALNVHGDPLDILSTLSPNLLHSDGHAFATLMQHLRDTDAAHATVLMVQVENEVGNLGDGRDRSPAANQLFEQPVPPELIRSLEAAQSHLSPELASQFHPAGRTWTQVFGNQADEAFMAWNYARFIGAVAAEGKKQYALPMYVNAQLPSPFERAGEYPSGGPHPYFLAIYRSVAPALDFFSPDIYWPNFAYWIERYNTPDNPIFIPEARLDVAPYNALYAFGQAHAFGFSPFDIDSLTPDPTHPPLLSQTYSLLSDLGDALPKAQSENRTRALVLHDTSPRATETVALGGYLFHATLARSWSDKSLLEKDGAMLLLQTAPNEFLVLGSGLNVTITRDPDVDAAWAQITSIDELSKSQTGWKIERTLNGDQTDQGRQILMDAHQMNLYRLKLFPLPDKNSR